MSGALPAWRRAWERLRAMVLLSEASDQRLAWSVAVGVGSVFVPLPGVQTGYVLAVCLLGKLNAPIALAINWLNNPVTLLMFVGVDFWAGSALLRWLGRATPPIDWAAISVDKVRPVLESAAVPLATGTALLLGTATAASWAPALWIVRRLRRRAREGNPGGVQ